MVFNVNGDAPGRYEIYQYQITNNTTEYKIIGHWTDQLYLDVCIFEMVLKICLKACMLCFPNNRSDSFFVLVIACAHDPHQTLTISQNYPLHIPYLTK